MYLHEYYVLRFTFTVDWLCFHYVQIDELRDSLDAALTRELPDEPKDAGCIRLDDVRPYLTEQQKADLQAEFKVGGPCWPRRVQK